MKIGHRPKRKDLKQHTNLGGMRQVECSMCFTKAAFPDSETLPVGWSTIASRLAHPRRQTDIRYFADYYCGTECFDLAIEEYADGTPLGEGDEQYEDEIWGKQEDERD